MTELITAATSVVVTLLAVWSTIIYPRSKEKKKAEAEAEKKEAERNQDIDGVETVGGEVVIPRLAVRVKAVESEMKKVTAGQSLLEQRMDEANGTGRATRQDVADIRAMMVELSSADLAKKQDVDAATRKVAAEAVGRQAETLHALAEHDD